MVEVAQSQSILLIKATVRCIYIVNKERAPESIDILSTNVSVIPVSTRLVDYEFVDKYSSRLNWTLGHHRWSVGIGRIDLVDTMEMEGSALIHKIVRQSDNNCITHIGSDRRAWPLPIDADKWS